MTPEWLASQLAARDAEAERAARRRAYDEWAAVYADSGVRVDDSEDGTATLTRLGGWLARAAQIGLCSPGEQGAYQMIKFMPGDPFAYRGTHRKPRAVVKTAAKVTALAIPMTLAGLVVVGATPLAARAGL